MTRTTKSNAAAAAPSEAAQSWPFSWASFNTSSPWTIWNGIFSEEATRVALGSLEATEKAFVAWRQVFDTYRAAVRHQQDTALNAFRSQLQHAGGDPKNAEAAKSVFAPMVAAAHAYEHVGEAVLEAQRDALAAFATSQRPH